MSDSSPLSRSDPVQSLPTADPNLPSAAARPPANPREYKFVPIDAPPIAKKRRIGLACKTCRKRKTRCTGERPACETCKQNGLECQGYQDQAPKLNTKYDVRARGDTTPVRSPIADRAPRIFDSPRNHQRHSSQPAVLPSHSSLRGATSDEDIDRADHQMGNHDDSYGVDDSFTDGAGTVYDTDSPKHAATDQDQSETHQARQDANAMSAFQTFDSDSPSQGSRQLFIEIRNQKPVFTTQSLGASPNTYPSSSQPSPGASTPSGAIPFYDPHSRDPVNPFITYLVDEFFTYVGYNFPFLRQGPFMRNLARKQICTLLVDAVCAVSARFSSDNLVTKASRRTASSQFSARAKSLVLTELQTPTLAAVQACLLLAYADFGTNKDAGIWMLLGISTKMAQFLGLHRIGKEANPAYYDTSTVKSEFEVDADDAEAAAIDRCNTFWAVYHLDQAISTITGRPVAFNDQIELDLLSPEEAGRWNNSVWTLIKRRDAMDQVQSGFQPSAPMTSSWPRQPPPAPASAPPFTTNTAQHHGHFQPQNVSAPVYQQQNMQFTSTGIFPGTAQEAAAYTAQPGMGLFEPELGWYPEAEYGMGAGGEMRYYSDGKGGSL